LIVKSALPLRLSWNVMLPAAAVPVLLSTMEEPFAKLTSSP
jgi:hypothetical protein